MKPFAVISILAAAIAIACFAVIVASAAIPVKLAAMLWMAACLAFCAVAGWTWRRKITRPLKNLSCLMTIAQKEGKSNAFLDMKCLEDVENAVRDLLRQLEDGQKSSLLAEMSHEIKTPLNGIIGFISNLNDTPLNQQQKQFLKIIDSSAQSLLHVINQILDYSKLSSGNLELENIAFDLKELAQGRCAVATQLAKNKGIKTSLLFPESEIQSIVRGDPTRLRQVLDNLLSNAVKFTAEGEVRMEISIAPVGDDDLIVDFAVKDTGIGMSPETIQKLFKPYRQAEASTQRLYGGTGLGLCISSSLVKLMGGTLAVQSQPSQGSNFHFTLTLKRATPEEQVRQPGPFAITLPKAELKKHRVLLVDDTPTNLFLLETVCQNAGLPYRTAVNGQEAVDLCLMHKFDIIFMDIQMPVMDGYTAIKKIRQLPNTAMTHIVALTASAFQEDIDRALRAGATEFIPKPFEKNQLLLCIADALAIAPEKNLLAQDEKQETEEEQTVRLMHEYMREQYQISLGEIKMTLAQTVADWRPLLDNLKAYTKSANYPQAREILHRLKGQLASIGLPQFAQTASVINEAMAATPVNPAIQQQVDSFIKKLSCLFKTLEQDVTVIH